MPWLRNLQTGRALVPDARRKRTDRAPRMAVNRQDDLEVVSSPVPTYETSWLGAGKSAAVSLKLIDCECWIAVETDTTACVDQPSRTDRFAPRVHAWAHAQT